MISPDWEYAAIVSEINKNMQKRQKFQRISCAKNSTINDLDFVMKSDTYRLIKDDKFTIRLYKDPEEKLSLEDGRNIARCQYSQRGVIVNAFRAQDCNEDNDNNDKTVFGKIHLSFGGLNCSIKIPEDQVENWSQYKHSIFMTLDINDYENVIARKYL